MRIYRATTTEAIEKCFPVMGQLRSHLSKRMFVTQVRRQQKSGYHLVYAENNNTVVSVAGFRVVESLVYGKFFYVDDFITDEKNRSRGYGSKLFDWLVDVAKKENCTEFHLDSGVQRFDAHRFYIRKRMNIVAHHFGLRLKS